MVYHLFTDVGIWASLGKAGIKKSHTTLGEIVRLHSCAVADKGSTDEYNRELDKAWIEKSHDCTIVQLPT